MLCSAWQGWVQYDVIQRSRPDTGGARVPPPRGEPFTPVAGAGAAGATVFAITPAILSRIMAKPELMRWAIEGMKVAPSTKRAHEVGGMLLGLLAKEGLLEEQPPQEQPAVNPASP